MPNYRRYYLPGRPVFVTIVTHQRKPWLTSETHVSLLFSSMRRIKAHLPFRHLAHVILPDHMHWLFEPTNTTDFSKIVSALKRDVTWRMKTQECKIPGPLWQKRFYDHVIRDKDDLAQHLDYIHFNPVKHGFAINAHHFPHSSLVEWVKRGVYDTQWGNIEPKTIKNMALE